MPCASEPGLVPCTSGPGLVQQSASGSVVGAEPSSSRSNNDADLSMFDAAMREELGDDAVEHAGSSESCAVVQRAREERAPPVRLRALSAPDGRRYKHQRQTLSDLQTLLEPWYCKSCEEEKEPVVASGSEWISKQEKAKASGQCLKQPMPTKERKRMNKSTDDDPILSIPKRRKKEAHDTAPCGVDEKVEAQAKAKAEAKATAEAKAEAEAKATAKAEAEAKAKGKAKKAEADADAKVKAEVEAKKAEAEAKAKAEAEAKAKKAEAEAKTKAKAEAEAKKAEAEAKVKAKAKAKAETEAKQAEAKAKAEAEAKKAEAGAKAKANAEAKAKNTSHGQGGNGSANGYMHRNSGGRSNRDGSAHWCKVGDGHSRDRRERIPKAGHERSNPHVQTRIPPSPERADTRDQVFSCGRDDSHGQDRNRLAVKHGPSRSHGDRDGSAESCRSRNSTVPGPSDRRRNGSWGRDGDRDRGRYQDQSPQPRDAREIEAVVSPKQPKRDPLKCYLIGETDATPQIVKIPLEPAEQPVH